MQDHNYIVMSSISGVFYFLVLCT